jgi:hypothetical protein
MSRNRIIYSSQALFAGPSPSVLGHYTSGNSGVNKIKQIHRVQSISHDYQISRSDVNQYGQLAAIDRVILEQPQVNLSFNYLAVDATNEARLGFNVDGSTTVISGILAEVEDDRNYFVQIVGPGQQDAVGYAGNDIKVAAISNGFITSYRAQGSVGGFASVDVGVIGLNHKFYNAESGTIPAVNPVNGAEITDYNFELPTAVSGEADQASAIRPGDITVTITPSAGTDVGIGVDWSDVKCQSYNLGFDLSREDLQKLGSKFAYSKEIQFPVTATCQIEAVVGDMGTGSLASILCDDSRQYDVVISLRMPSCTGDGAVAIQYTAKAMKIDSQNFGSSIGPSNTVSFNFSTQLSGPGDLSKGLFISGVNADA